MIIVTCPRCGDQVTIPAGAAREAQVQCPLCQEQYGLADVFDHLPPQLMVLGTSQPLEPVGPATQAPDEEQPPADEEIRLAPEPRETRPEQSGPIFRVQSSTGQFTNRSFPRVRRRRSPQRIAWEIGKVALGALLAIPLAQLILWYLPGSLQRDPLNLGPPISRYAAWIVPTKFHDPRIAQRQEPRPLSAKEVRQQQVLIQAEKYRRERHQQIQAAHARAQNEGQPRRRDPQPELAEDDESLPSSADAQLTSSADEPLPEIDRAIAAVEAAHRAWDDAGAPTDTVRERLYNALAEMGSEVADLEPADPQLFNRLPLVHRLLQDVATDGEKLALVDAEGPERVEQPPAEADAGVVLHGHVARIATAGVYYESDLTLVAEPPQMVKLVSRHEPEAFFQEGSKILALGKVTDRPSELLIGYQSSAPVVVVIGYALEVEEQDLQAENGGE